MLLYCSSISAFAQDNASEKIICRSRLTDALSGEILPFATVRTVDASTITNIDGEFEVIVDRNDTLHLSYVGYHSLDIKASELQSTVSLRPASHLLHDIDVVSTRSRIASVVETVINETTKHQSERSDYLYRQTTERDGETTSLVEARFNACSALSLRKMRLIGGRYSALDKGNSESFSYSALFVPFSQTPIATKSKMVFEREMMVPFYWEYNDFYDIDYDILYDNMRTAYAIHFTPRGNYLGRVIHGTAYIDASSQQLLKFEGKIDGVFVINRHRTDNEILPATVLFTTIYNHEREFCEVQSIYVNAEYVSGKNEYGFRSLIYNTGAAQKKKGKKFNDTKDLRAQIDALADDTEFWKGTEIVKRTDVEAELAKIGDIDDVEESSPTQLMQRKDKESIDTFINNIDKFNRLFPQEKVYLHFDNTAYYRNETIWFKAYVMRANDMRQTDMSKVLYVELLNPSGDVMETRKLKIENGQADGSIKLDKLFISGFYEVRAYTRYMLNWDSNGIFSRVFPVFNTVKKEGDYSKAVIDTYSDSKRLPDNRATEDADNDRRLNVRFFPEGGHLVRGLQNMVAFEVTEQGGESIDTNGYLRLANGDTISVSTLREGRGLFVYTPTAEPATLTMRNRKGREYDFELPQAEETGCVLSANTLGKDNIRLRVSRGMQFRERLAMMLVNNGNVEVFEEIPQNMPTAEYTIPKKLLNDGVSQVAVINPNGDILAERMVFVYPQTRYDTIKVEAQNKQLIPCGRITLDAETRANTTFSVAVRDYDTEKNGSSMNAATWLLLSSELKGYIHNAEYYLENDDEKHRRAADLLMMVQGWSRYDLPMMMGRKAFESKQPIEEGLLVDGRLRQKTKKDSVDNVDMRITLFNRLGNSMSGKARTDKEGNYVFGIPDCEGEFSLILHTKKDGKDTDYRIGINRTFSPVGRRLSPYEIQRHPLDTPMIKIMVPDNFDYMIPTKTDKYNKVLRDVVVKGRRIYDNARAAWENESFGEYKAVVRYDCQKEVDKLLDEGKDLPRFFDWLKGRNKFFEGSSADMEMAITDDDWTHQAEKPFSNSDDIHHVFGEMGRVRSRIGHQILLPFQGLSYKNRPVVWILNNQYYYTSMVSVAVGHLDFHSYDNISPEQMPFDLGEFKSVYITENEVEWMQYTNIDNLVRYSSVTVFLYTFHEFPVGNIGGRRTTFDAYARKETYDMPDYSVIPPMADYRRTLYWNPNVKTDKNGKAKIEFYNNSTCRQIIVSAEGITTDGRAVVY